MIFTKFQKLKKKLTCWKKLAKKKNIFCTGPPPPPELHIRIMKKIWIPCTGVHGFEEKSKFHVPGYIDLKKKHKIMYPDTWVWRKNKIPCTGVHEILISFTILMCSSGGGGPGFYFFIFLAIFFNMLKKIQFLEFCKDQGGKI